MGFFQKLKNGLIRLMYGRNGVDRLGLAMIWACLIVDIVSMFLMPRAHTAGRLLYWASMVLWVVAIFRIFSRNLCKRRAENAKWMSFWGRIRGKNTGAQERHADKDHKYFTCKNCKTICRVPVGKGKVVITCPKCGAEIHGRT